MVGDPEVVDPGVLGGGCDVADETGIDRLAKLGQVQSDAHATTVVARPAAVRAG